MFLGMILLNASGNEFNANTAASKEEELWGVMNENSKWTIEREATIVDDNDDWGVFLIDALAPSDETAFLTREGTTFIWVKLRAMEAGFAD